MPSGTSFTSGAQVFPMIHLLTFLGSQCGDIPDAAADHHVHPARPKYSGYYSMEDTGLTAENFAIRFLQYLRALGPYSDPDKAVLRVAYHGAFSSLASMDDDNEQHRRNHDLSPPRSPLPQPSPLQSWPDRLGVGPIPAGFFDAELAPDDPSRDRIYQTLICSSLSAHNSVTILKAWLCRPGESETFVNPNNCVERDMATCLITGFREPIDTAPIVSYTRANKSELGSPYFWIRLHMLWSEEQITAWENAVQEAQKTDSCANQLSMTNLAHKLWAKARFALRPVDISNDERTMTVQFFWLPRMEFSNHCLMDEAPSAFAADLASSQSEDKTYAKLFRLDTDTKVRSGDILTIRTTDPVNRPLPSFQLLRLQWILHRIVALSGVADASDEDIGLFGYEESDDRSSTANGEDVKDALIPTEKGVSEGEEDVERIRVPEQGENHEQQERGAAPPEVLLL